jgi:hypothetical protein
MMKRLVLLVGLVCYALPAQAITLAEAMKGLKASKFNDYWDDKDGKARLLGKIQAGKRLFWVVETKVPGLKTEAAGRLFCRVAILEETAGRITYLGNYHPDCEEAFRVNGQRIEHMVTKPGGTQVWAGFALTEKGPPPKFYGDDPDLYPFFK